MAAEIYGAVNRRGPKMRTPRHLLSVMGDISGPEGICWARVAYLADACCMSEKQVSRTLDALQQEGWITVLRKQTGNYPSLDGVEFAQGKQSVYHLNLDKLGITPATAPKLFARQKASRNALKSPDTMSADSHAKQPKHAPKAALSPRPQESEEAPSLRTVLKPDRAESQDRMSAESEVLPEVLHSESADIPQGAQRTFVKGSADICEGVSGHLRIGTVGRTGSNRNRTGIEPESTKPIPPTPLTGGEDTPDAMPHNPGTLAEAAETAETAPPAEPSPPGRDWVRANTPFGAFYYALRRSLTDAAAAPPTSVTGRFRELVPGLSDWDSGFEKARLAGEENVDGQLVWLIAHPDPRLCAEFLRKYAKRVQAAMVATLGLEWQLQVRDLREAA